MNAVEIGPVPETERTQSPFDLFLIWAGADIVATTLQVGASLAPFFPAGQAAALIVLGALGGGALIAALAPLGPRLGVPSIIAARAALGIRGAGLVALFMYVTNFAWIAVNNVIAASSCAAIAGGESSERWWAVGLGVVSTLVVAGGPRLVARTDRIAVPLMFALCVALTVACVRLSPASSAPPASLGQMSWARGLDLVIGYQASWILMFADYSRYTRSPAAAGGAVFLGLGGTSLWLMSVGLLAATAAGSSDPGAMLRAAGLGTAGAVLMALGTVTTNFVNIYLSALAWKSLLPRSSQQLALWVTGLTGAALSVLSRAWLDRFADFMWMLGGAFVPVGGILLARFFLVRRSVNVASLYDPAGPHGRHFGFSIPGIVAWSLGALVFRYFPEDYGGTLPSLLVAALAYVAAFKAMPADN
jgi:nucleobase:cation symporter-1, NCS1 family